MDRSRRARPCHDCGATITRHSTALLCWPCSKRRQEQQSRCSAWVRRAIEDGEIAPLDGSVQCIECDRAATNYSHTDYSKPLDVEPVCDAHLRQEGLAKLAAAVPNPPHKAVRNKGGAKRIYPLGPKPPPGPKGDAIHHALPAHFKVETNSFASLDAVMRYAVGLGYTGSKRVLGDRLRAGAATWAELCRSPSPEHSAKCRAAQKNTYAKKRAEMAAVIAALDARKKAA